MDEGSQYDDSEWERFCTSIQEQVTDFQQLQPVVSGVRSKAFCGRMERVTLETVYRSASEEHLLFINRIRAEQPTRDRAVEYFGDRHWSGQTLD